MATTREEIATARSALARPDSGSTNSSGAQLDDTLTSRLDASGRLKESQKVVEGLIKAAKEDAETGAAAGVFDRLGLRLADLIQEIFEREGAATKAQVKAKSAAVELKLAHARKATATELKNQAAEPPVNNIRQVSSTSDLMLHSYDLWPTHLLGISYFPGTDSLNMYEFNNY